MIKKQIILFFLFFCVNVFAQDPIHYTTKQGLPSNHIYDIAQDSNGFMWFATNRGLVKFDGEKFKIFSIKDGLPNTGVWKIESDFKGRIWYSSKSNQQGYVKNDSVYKFYTPNRKVISPTVSHKSKDRIWSLSAGGILTLKKDTLQEVFYKHIGGHKGYVEKMKLLGSKYDFYYPSIRTFINPEYKELTVIKKNEILVFNIQLELLYRIAHAIPLSEINNNKDITQSSLLPNQIHCVGMDTGILFIDYKAKISKFFLFKDLIAQEKIHHIFIEPLGNEVQVSAKGYLMRFDYDLNVIEVISFPDEYPHHRSYKDTDGNIWLADFATGVTLLPNTQQETAYFFKDKKIIHINKMGEEFVVAIAYDGYYKGNFDALPFKKIKSNPFETNNSIQYNPKTKEGYLFGNGGALRYKNGKFKPISLSINGHIEPWVFFNDYFKYQKSEYYISSSAILKKELDSNKASKIVESEGFGSSYTYNDIVYIGKSDGLFEFKNDSLLKVDTKGVKIKGVAFLAKAKDHLVIGTNRGVYLHSNKGTIHLKNTDYYTILKIIAKGNIFWLATQNGVLKVALNTDDLSNSKVVQTFYKADGLLQNNTNDIYLDGNDLYVASDVGLSKINTAKSLNDKKPNLYFKTDNDTITISSKDTKNIAVTFGVLNFVNQDNITYEYRLLPNHKKWITTESKILNFTNLSSRLHVLEVKASNQFLKQSIAKQYIQVLPYWWQTIWAKIAFIVLFLLFLGLLFSFFMRRFRKKEKERIVQNQRVASLELQALRSQMNPHFVHNSLNAIQYYIQRNEVELSEDYLEKFSKLIRMFFEYSRKATIAIKDEILLLRSYLEMEQLRFEDKLSFKIRIDSEIDQELQKIPAMLLQPIVENSVNHGLFHKKGKGNISIQFITINDLSFKVIILDDGIGIDKAKEIYKNSSRNYRSKSSDVLQERLELLMLSNEWDITYLIKDLKEDNQTGTLVQLTFNQLTKNENISNINR